MNMLVTNAGLAALVNAEATGTDTITISQIKFGSGQYTPTKTQTAMQTPFKTLTALSGGAVSANTLHVTAEDASTDTYTVYEVGVFLSDGTLFAVGSQTTPILQKASGAVALLSVDIALADHSAATVTVGDTNFFNPQATTETKGVVELATADETKAGTDAARAVTPASLKAELDVRDSGLVHTTGNETVAGAKTFTSALAVKSSSPAVDFMQTDVTKGTAPTSTHSAYSYFKDAVGKILGAVVHAYDSTKSSEVSLSAYKSNSAADSESASVSVVFPAEGSPYATAPTPADPNDRSAKIATTAWVKALAEKYLPLSGGSMTNPVAVKRDVSNSYLGLYGGTGEADGAELDLYGKDSAAYPGRFTLGASDGTNASALRGLPNGTLTWNEKSVLTSDNEKTLKYLIDEAQFSVDALGKSFHYGLLWLGVENFEDTADVNTSIGAGGSVADYYDATNHLIVKTGSGSIVLQSTSQTCAKNNAAAWAYPDWTGSGSLKVEISRDGGTTFTTVTSDTMTSISSQPTGTSMVCRLTLTGQVTLKNIAWGCK